MKASLQPQLGPMIVKHAAAGVLIAFCLLSILLLIREASFLFLLHEAAYGDSYILYDVLQLQKTGIIYRDLSQPPYLPAQYSPIVYILYSLPGRFVAWDNPFVGPRLIVIAAFLVCIGIVTSIVSKLIPVRFVWVWSILLACSISSMWKWILQIRADFPGICFSLLAIRLLLSRASWAVPVAGICAGFAMQFKITFVAAAAAGALWLLFQRQWKNLAKFTALAAMCAAGPYLLYSVREPLMLPQMLALSPGIADVSGSLLLMRQALRELVILLALLSFPPVAWRTWPRWALIFIFAATSFAVGGLTDLQAGGNVNYYFEMLFAVVPMAVFGVLRLVVMARRNAMLGLLVALFGIYFLAPRALALYGEIENVGADEAFLKVAGALHGQRIFSTIPRLALLDPHPPLLEPYLLTYMHRLGKLDPKPILESIRNNEYDVVITAARPQNWRGVLHIDPDVRNAIVGSYSPQCTLRGWLLQLPRHPHSTSSDLAQQLANMGCEPVPASTGPSW